jgi:hypothetical protein
VVSIGVAGAVFDELAAVVVELVATDVDARVNDLPLSETLSCT